MISYNNKIPINLQHPNKSIVLGEVLYNCCFYYDEAAKTKEYVCTVCGYVHQTDAELPGDYQCPVFGAGKDVFQLKEEATEPSESRLEKPHTEKELSATEMSIICSNL